MFRFEQRLLEIMKFMHQTHAALEGRLKAEGFKVRVIKVLKAWEDAAIYTRDFLHRLHNVFLGLDEVSLDTISSHHLLIFNLFLIRVRMVKKLMIRALKVFR